jgi:hypothetical protein
MTDTNVMLMLASEEPSEASPQTDNTYFARKSNNNVALRSTAFTADLVIMTQVDQNVRGVRQITLRPVESRG